MLADVLTTATASSSTSSAISAAIIGASGVVVAAVLTFLSGWRRNSYDRLLDDIDEILEERLKEANDPNYRVRRRR
jgi:hypothetical protein